MQQGVNLPRARAARVLVLGSVLSTMVACGNSGDDSTEGQDPWEPPAWFAEQAQERELARVRLQSCIDELGWDREIDEWGGSPEGFSDDEEMSAFVADSDECLQQVGLRADHAAPTVEELELLYAMEVDGWWCIVAQGFDIPGPPSVEVFVEQSLDDSPPGEVDAWTPYIDDALLELPEHEYRDLLRTCPEPWVW